jgi:riboflavin biosynthesis pyrimidine reductase
VGRSSIARQCIERRLLDEIAVHLAPVLLGEGVRFYEAPGVGQIRLERTDLANPGQITDLRFRVVR